MFKLKLSAAREEQLTFFDLSFAVERRREEGLGELLGPCCSRIFPRNDCAEAIE